MASTPSKDRRPPYVPYQTLANFLKGYPDGLPNRLDSKLLESTNGTLRAQLLAALKYLSLIDDDKTVSPELHKIVGADEAERKKLMADVIRKSYTFIFNDRFDLANSSDSDFRHQFETSGVSNDVLRKSVTFFLLAAKEAGIPLSRHIQEPLQRAPAKTSRSSRKSRGGGKRTPGGDTSGKPADGQPEAPPDAAAANLQMMDFFTPIAKWPKAQREAVFTFTEKLIGLIRARS